MSNRAPYSTRQLTKYVRELANQAFTIEDDGTDEPKIVTNSEALAQLLWRRALGDTTTVRDDQGVEKTVVHKPEVWAIQMIYERLEGKVPQSVDDPTKGLSAAVKVSELAKTRLNNEADAAVAISESTGSVDLPDHGVEGSEGPGSEPGMASEDAPDG